MYITREYVKNHPEKIFIFGDNCMGIGLGGQAKNLRGEPNSFGIPTKKLPSSTENAFFTDDEFYDNTEIIDKAIARIPLDCTEIVILPLGVGLAQLPRRAPKTYEYLILSLTMLKVKKMWI